MWSPWCGLFKNFETPRGEFIYLATKFLISGCSLVHKNISFLFRRAKITSRLVAATGDISLSTNRFTGIFMATVLNAGLWGWYVAQLQASGCSLNLERT